MGKKSKQGKKKSQPSGDEGLTDSKPSNGNGLTEATNGMVGLSKHSKKIKKEKKRLLEAAKLAEVVELAPDAVETSKPDKKKKKKKQNQKENKSDVETEPKEMDQDNESGTPKVSKKSKKQSNKKKKDKKKPKVLAADNDVVTSESESEAELEDAFKEMDTTNQSILSHPDVNDGSDDEVDKKKSAGKKPIEEKKEKRFPGREHSIFIGNLPRETKQGLMKTLFKPYGRVLTVRFRTFDGVHLLNKKDRKEAKALNCYIRFETKQEAEAACAMNGQLVEGNRIRVTMQSQKQVGHNTSTVFVGNINRKTTDNELYDFFSRVGDIEYVRQIADKGIGYVCFKKGVSIAKALKMNQELLDGRPLRIMKVDPNIQSTRRNKKGNLVKKNRLPGGIAKQPTSADDQKSNVQKEKTSSQEFHGTVTKNKRDKKKKKGNSDKKKKVLAQKLMAAGAPKKKE